MVKRVLLLLGLALGEIVYQVLSFNKWSQSSSNTAAAAAAAVALSTARCEASLCSATGICCPAVRLTASHPHVVLGLALSCGLNRKEIFLTS